MGQFPSLADIGAEFSLINWIQQRSQHTRIDSILEIGIGDDTAILKPQNREMLVTKDVLTEGVHFRLSDATLGQIGRKALAVNLSDIAAMAGEPTVAFIGIVIPRDFKRVMIVELFEGLISLAEDCDVKVAGGDTNVWDGPLVISVTLLGLAHVNGSVLRSGAKPGDQIFVTGALGGSLPSGRHLSFEPRVQQAQQLRDHFDLHALLDVSDGIASDLRHILQASNVGAVLNAEQIPIHHDVDAALSQETRLQHALCDGEDFELLFTISADDAEKLVDQNPLSIPVTRIGEIRKESGLFLRLGTQESRLEQTGWVHQ